MWISTKVVWDAERVCVIAREGYDYSGPIELCKGGPAKQEQALANQQLQMQNALTSSQLGMVNPTLAKIIGAGGMLPETETAMNSLALNSLPQQYNNLFGKLSQELVQRGVTGGGNAGGGEIARQFGALGSQEAGQQANLLENVQLAKQQGLNQALGLAEAPVGPLIGGASSALSSGTQAAGAATQAETGFWGSLFGALTAPIAPAIGKWG